MSYKDKDMLLDIVDTGDELKPFVRPQHWSEGDNEWKTTGEENPMPVVLKDNDEIIDIAGRRLISLALFSFITYNYAKSVVSSTRDRMLALIESLI